MRTIDWTRVAHRLGYATELVMWQALYEEKKLSIVQLGVRFGVGSLSVRAALGRNRISIRRKGGAKRRRSLLTESELLAVRAEGLPKAAKRLRVPYATLYQKVKRSEACIAAAKTKI
jgi:hypothetical protein